MSKFRAAPRLQSEEAFVKAAEAPRKPVASVVAAAPPPSDIVTSANPVKPSKKSKKPVALKTASASMYPWEEYDAGEKAVASQQPLRLNAYQYEQLKWLAQTEDRSLAQILRRIVGPALEDAVSSER